MALIFVYKTSIKLYKNIYMLFFSSTEFLVLKSVEFLLLKIIVKA